MKARLTKAALRFYQGDRSNFDEFMKSNKLTGDQMSELCRISTGTLDAVEAMAWKKFQDMCQ